jgi:hypothetical protein
MTLKATHFGMAGHYVAMAEFLRRGWNVATAAVDIGDDIYVVHDGDGTFARVQVKARKAIRDPADQRWLPVRFPVSREQLFRFKDTDLYYMFMLFQGDRWHYLLLSQSTLGDIRIAFESRPPRIPGKPIATAETARGDDLGPNILFDAGSASFWGVVLPANAWHPDFPELSEGPGARSRPSRP